MVIVCFGVMGTEMMAAVCPYVCYLSGKGTRNVREIDVLIRRMTVQLRILFEMTVHYVR